MPQMNKGKLFADTATMFRRSMTRQLRSPQTVVMALIVPIVMMIMFGQIFGGVAEVGYGISYINFVVPGILIMCINISAQSGSYAVNLDMTRGIIDRFRSMPIAKSAVISGHVGVSVIRSIVVVFATFIAAFVMGFRTSMPFSDWLILVGILLLFIIALTWVTVIIGLVAVDPEALGGTGFLLQVFVFLSSAFAPTDTMPTVLRVFAAHQPISRVIYAMRGLVLGMPDNRDIAIAVIWCVGIIIVATTLSITIYRKKLTQ